MPDDNFEAWIETTYSAADNGAVNDNYVLTAGLVSSLQNIISVDINSANTPGPIFDLTGIEDFRAISYNINDLNITHLDLTDLNNYNVNNFYNTNLIISDNQFLEEIIFPSNDSIKTLRVQNNDSLQNIVFHPGLFFSQFILTSCRNFCKLNLMGNIIDFGVSNSTQIALSDLYKLTEIDFSAIYSAPYQTPVYINQLWYIDASFNIVPANIQRLNFNGPVSVYNWDLTNTDFSNLPAPLPLRYNYIPCIEFASSADASYCAGSNEWPDSATYSTNCYTPVSCQVSTSISEASSQNRELYKVIDILGRNSKGRTNQPLFYIYTDGTVEKKMVIE